MQDRIDWKNKYLEGTTIGSVFTMSKFLILILIAFWATQAHFDFSQANVRRIELTKVHVEKLRRYISEEEARLPVKLSPERYYAVMRKLMLKDVELSHPQEEDYRTGMMGMSPITTFQQCHSPIATMIFQSLSSKEQGRWRTEAEKFLKWEDKLPKQPEEPAFKAIREAGVLGILHWIIVFYLRCMPLFLAIYFLSMIQRGGWAEIRQQVRKNPARTLLSVVLWPRYCLVFPYDIVSELWLETLIRRTGKSVGRILTDRESEEIESLRASENPRELIREYQTANAHRFVRCWQVALLVTVVIHLFGCFMPIETKADEKAGKTRIVAVARAGPIIVCSNDAHQDFQAAESHGWVPEIWEKPDDYCLGVIRPVNERAQDGSPQRIEHIPWGYLNLVVIPAFK